MIESGLPVPEIAIRLLGGAAIERSGVPMADRAAHRHGLGLLALLATARGRLLSRDKIVALLWPEGDPDSVRHRLNVLVYELRRTLGRAAIISVNDSLRLDADVIWVDVNQYASAIERGDADEAFALYRGDFLDGFHLPDAHDFDEWIAGERDRLAAELRRVLERQATNAMRNGDQSRAVHEWRRLVQLDPVASRPTIGLMRALAATGDRHAALQVAAAHGIRQAEQVGSPDPEVEQLARSLRVAEPMARVPADSSGTPAVPAEAPVGATAMAPVAPPSTASETRWNKRALLAVAAAAVLLVMLWPRLRGERAVAEGSARVVASDVVILPFTVHGERHAYLADGMAELMSITLDGAGSFRTADPHAVLAFVRQQPDNAREPETGRRVAAQFLATHFVLGSVVESGLRMDLRASLYGSDGSLHATATGTVEEGGDLAAAVDSLTRQLIASMYRGGVERLTRLAVATSASLPALKAYLEGEERRRTGDHEGAVDAFGRATRIDSTFALAWYRLAVALESTLQPGAAREAGGAAVRHSARLPGRDRLLLEGWHAYSTGRADEAEALYRRILDLYPNEVEAWLQAGEIAFHHAASRGGGIAVARPAFDRVLELDPDHEAAHVHLARVAAAARDVPALRRHAGYLVTRRAGTGVALEMAALQAFIEGDAPSVANLRREFQEQDSYTVVAMLMNLFHAGHLDGMAWCADLLLDPARPVEVRTAGHIVTALLDVSRGDLVSARRAAARAEALDPARGLELRALMATLPFLAVDTAESRRVRQALAAAVNDVVTESFFLPDADGMRPLLRRYLVGLLDAQLGDYASALSNATLVEGLTHGGADSLLARDLAAGVRAEVARQRGDLGEALALLDGISGQPRYQLVLPSPLEPRVRERFLRAVLLDANGRGEEARVLLTAIGTQSLYDLPYRAPSQARLQGSVASRR